MRNHRVRPRPHGWSPPLRGASSRVAAWCALALLVALAAPARAQEPAAAAPTILAGSVVDAATGAPIQNAIVSVPAMSRAVLTNDEGAFQLRGVPGGTWIVRVQRFGYRDVLRTVRVGEGLGALELLMEIDPVELEQLTVTVDGAVTLSGTVIDASSGRPMPDVLVWLPNEERGALTDSSGTFALAAVPTGPQLVQVEHMGYGRRYLPLVLTPPQAPLVIQLRPDVAVLHGIPEVDDELRGRRNAYAGKGIVRAFGAQRPATAIEDDVRLVVQNQTFANLIACTGSMVGMWCVEVGGEPVEPTVYIDGRRVLAGLDELMGYEPHELYLLEVYPCGTQVRAYTYGYVESVARAFEGVLPPDEQGLQPGGVGDLGWETRTLASGSFIPRDEADVANLLGPRALAKGC